MTESTHNRTTAGTGGGLARHVGVVLLVVVLVGAAAVGPAVAAGDGPTARERAPMQDSLRPLSSDGYAAIQGDRCVPIEPLGDGYRTVGEYYDYRNPNSSSPAYTYSSYGTTHLQEDDASLLFLHEGRDGLNLVVVHDRLEGSTAGGSATMQFDDLPAAGTWAVEDDDYEGRDDVFTHRNGSSRITWVWSEGRTDGAAFAGLGEDFAITITPAFGERADFRYTDGGYDGRVTDWQVLSGDDRDPARTSLAMDEPVVIRSGGCSAVIGLDVADSASVGEQVRIGATVTNEGVGEESVTVPFVVDGEVVDEQSVTLAAGETRTLSTTVRLDEAGTRTVSVGSERAELTVADSGFGDDLSGFGVVAALVGVAVVLLIGRRR